MPKIILLYYFLQNKSLNENSKGEGIHAVGHVPCKPTALQHFLMVT